MADINRTSPTARAPATVTIALDDTDGRSGTASLTPIKDARGGHIVFIVTVDARAAQYFGIPADPDTIGGLVRLSSGWSPTAYRDREHLLAGTGLAYFLPNAPSRVRAVRALLRWWFEVGYRIRTGADPRHMDPFAESPGFRRRLLA